jgi:3-methyladenine DNA glycosylase/8-oxoguanine DNA glycosylase
MVSKSEWESAAASLAERHPALFIAYERHGALAPKSVTPVDQRFEALASAIAFQQLAGKAAAAIWSRVTAAVGEPFSPEEVLAAGPATLRAAGLSGAKVVALLDLADQVTRRSVRLDAINRLADDAVVDHLTQVRGIGPWTAQMFLMFHLRRVDVWPTGDLGVRNGYGVIFGCSAPTQKELNELGNPYAPYRSVLAQWCWRAVDDPDGVW